VGTGDRRTVTAPAGSSNPSRLFTVRIRTEVTGDGIEHRGSVRDVQTGAFVHFRTWTGLTAFLAARIEEHQHDDEEST
jgi:hypothetical protein